MLWKWISYSEITSNHKVSLAFLSSRDFTFQWKKVYPPLQVESCLMSTPFFMPSVGSAYILINDAKHYVIGAHWWHGSYSGGTQSILQRPALYPIFRHYNQRYDAV